MKFRQIISIALIALLLAGCGGSGNAGGSGQNAAAETTATTTAAQTTTAATTTTTAAETKAAETTAAAKKSAGLPLAEEKVTLTMYWPADATALTQITDYNDNPVWQEIEKQTNVHIDWFHGGSEQLTMMINSGDFTDMIAHWSINDYPGGGDKAIADGAYLRLNELMEEFAPNYMGLLNKNPDMKRDAVSDIGNIVGFGMLEDIVQGPFTGLGLRQDWLDDLGLAQPVTYDDWHDMLTAFKNEKNAVAPLSLYANVTNHWQDAGDLSAGFGVVPRFFQIDKIIKFGPIEPGYKDYLALMAKWYSEGLIDKDFNTRDDEGVDQLKYTNQAGAWFTGFWLLEFHKRNSEDPNYREVAVPSPVQKVGDKVHFRQTNRHYRGQESTVSTKCKNPELAVRWLDNLYSEENYILMNYGIEGQGYYIGEDGEYYLTDLVTHNPNMNVAQAMNVYSVHSGSMRRIWWREQASYTDDERACEGIWYAMGDEYTIPATTTFTAEEGERFTVIMSDVNTYVLEKTIAFIMGTESLDNYNAFCDQIKQMNIEEAIKIKQASLDRYYAR